LNSKTDLIKDNLKDVKRKLIKKKKKVEVPGQPQMSHPFRPHGTQFNFMLPN
jgi:hypothetical protein